jgi:biotin carboxyl carrier protein
MKLLITVQGIRYEVDVEVIDDSIQKPVIESLHATPAAHPHVPVTPAPQPPGRAAPSHAPVAGNDAQVISPIAGNVSTVEVKPGQQVKTNDVLIILEAMKMETPIKSPRDAVIKSISVATGDAVKAGQTLLEFE